MLVKQELLYRDLKIDLSKNPLKRALLNAFIGLDSSLQSELNHDQLVEKVYMISRSRKISKRMKESNRQRLGKLIIRTRQFMVLLSSHSDQIEWLPYNSRTKLWKLYRQNNCENKYTIDIEAK